jgi:hypothetical protein
MSDNSIIRQMVDSIARKLSEHEYFRTVPKIPVIVEDHKDIEQSILKAMQSTGAFVLVNFQSGESDTPDTPGPYISDGVFQITVSEIPSVWRSNRTGPTPSCTMIAESCARILQHYQLLDADDAALTGGVLTFGGMTQMQNDSMLQQSITFNTPVPLSNIAPTR